MRKIPKYDASDLKPFWEKHNWLLRIYAVVVLVTLPLWVTGFACRLLWEERREIVDTVKETSSAAFLPWKR